jgi:protein-disulfide isomerase
MRSGATSASDDDPGAARSTRQAKLRRSFSQKKKEKPLSDQSSGGSLIVASIILALSIVTGSFIIKSSLDEGAFQVASLVGEMQALAEQVAAAPSPQQAPNRPTGPARPDPSRRYEVEIGEAPIKGPKSAEIEIVEWSDFECPFCSRALPTLAQIEKEYGDKVQIAFKHMPLSMHARARPAHAAAEAARLQGKFWEMHDLIFSNQRALSEEKYAEYATQLGLDVEKFKKDSASPEVEARIAADYAQATKLGVTGTPAFFVNGRFLSGAQPFPTFKALIDDELAKN